MTSSFIIKSLVFTLHLQEPLFSCQAPFVALYEVQVTTGALYVLLPM